MDIQLKRGLLDVCVLAAIKNEDSYGYRIIKDMKPFIELSESTLYTILKRLETAKMLTVRTAEHDGRLRKYYRITEAGARRNEEVKSGFSRIMNIKPLPQQFAPRRPNLRNDPQAAVDIYGYHSHHKADNRMMRVQKQRFPR